MTIEEIRKFLDDTKVYVNGKSKEIQEKLFSFGYRWHGSDLTEATHTTMPFLFIHRGGDITYENNMNYFVNHENREISADEILSLEISALIKPFVEETNRKDIINDIAIEYATEWVDKFDDGNYKKEINHTKWVSFCEGARWSDEHPILQWIDASLTKPEQDEEVVVLLETALEGNYKIAFGCIVDKSKCVDYNGWNIEGVRYWLPCPELPK